MDRPPRRPDPLSPLRAELEERLPGDGWQPAVDVFENEKAVVVRVELAGVASSDVKVTVDGDWLRIRGHRTPAASEEVRRIHRMEIPFGPFERRLRITIPFERDQVAASLEDGFLQVTLPKRLPLRHRVTIRGGEVEKA